MFRAKLCWLPPSCFDKKYSSYLWQERKKSNLSGSTDSFCDSKQSTNNSSPFDTIVQPVSSLTDPNSCHDSEIQMFLFFSPLPECWDALYADLNLLCSLIQPHCSGNKIRRTGWRVSSTGFHKTKTNIFLFFFLQTHFLIQTMQDWSVLCA